MFNFRAGNRLPTIAAKRHAVKTNDLSQLVEAVTKKRQELFVTPAFRCQTISKTLNIHVRLHHAVSQEQVSRANSCPTYHMVPLHLCKFVAS